VKINVTSDRVCKNITICVGFNNIELDAEPARELAIALEKAADFLQDNDLVFSTQVESREAL